MCKIMPTLLVLIRQLWLSLRWCWLAQSGWLHCTGHFAHCLVSRQEQNRVAGCIALGISRTAWCPDSNRTQQHGSFLLVPSNKYGCRCTDFPEIRWVSQRRRDVDRRRWLPHNREHHGNCRKKYIYALQWEVTEEEPFLTELTLDGQFVVKNSCA